MKFMRLILASAFVVSGTAWSAVSDWVVVEATSEERTSVVLTIPVSLQRLYGPPAGVRCELRQNNAFGNDNGSYGYWTSPAGTLPYDSYTGNGSGNLIARLEIRRSTGDRDLLPAKEPIHVQCKLLPTRANNPNWEVSDKPPTGQQSWIIKSNSVVEVRGEVLPAK